MRQGQLPFFELADEEELSAEYRKIFHVTQLEQGIRLHDDDWIFGNIAFGTS